MKVVRGRSSLQMADDGGKVSSQILSGVEQKGKTENRAAVSISLAEAWF